LKKETQKGSIQKWLIPPSHKRSSKRAKQHDNQINLTDNGSKTAGITIAMVSKQVCTTLTNWAKKQKEDCFNQMTEDEDYFLQISPQEKQGFLKCI